MTQRERVLAIGVGGMALLVGGVFLYWSILTAFAFRTNQITSFRKKLEDQTRLVKETNDAKMKIAAYQRRSLPPQKELARTLYQGWLVARVEQVGLADPKVANTTQAEARDLYTQLNFSVTAKGTLPQIVQLLQEFYSVDYLHRISRMSLRPLKDSKLLSLSMTVEALSMQDAAPVQKLAPRPGNRLKLSREDYVKAIVERNLFAPANQPPRLSGLGSRRAERGRELEISSQVSDPDALDKVFAFRLEKSADSGARLDSSSGRFRWTPPQNGTYEFVISVTDDGIPAKTTTEKLVVTVTDPSPSAPPTRTLAFDEAKYTFLTAVINDDGQAQVWLDNRPRGKVLKRGIGEPFEVGSVKGVVKSIGAGDFVFESDGKLKKLDIGGTLEQAATVPQ